jgi:oligopeptide transport system substrate-binding protein
VLTEEVVVPPTLTRSRRPSARALVPLLAALALLLPLLAASVATAQDADAKVLRIHQRFYPSLLDPQQAAFIDDIAVISLTYEGLTRLDENLAIVPAAAESWEFNGDGTELTFHLREGLTYSDGSPLTAERFRDAAMRTCSPLTAGLYQSILFPIEGCEELATSMEPGEDGTPVATPVDTDALAADFGVTAPDDRTVVIQLREPAPYFVAVASLWVFYPAKAELIEAGGEDWWLDAANHVGNGPFQLAAMEEEQQITFSANDAYWAGRPVLDTIEYVYIKDNAVAVEAYRQGEVDIVYVDPSQIPAISQDPALSEEFLQYRGANTFEISFNLRQAPFDDKKVREAFAYAFDRETWCAEVFSGGCLPTTTWIPEGIPGAVEDTTYAFDLEKARQALADSSYGSAEALPPITYTYVTDDPAEQVRAEWIAGQYRDLLGIELELVGYDYATWVSFFSSAEDFPQMTPSGWGQDYPDPQNWLTIQWTCTAASLAVNIGYCNKQVDEMVARGDTELDPTKRVAHYEEAHRLMLADAPSVVTHNLTNQFLVKPAVSGYVPTASDSAFPGQWGSLLTLDVER